MGGEREKIDEDIFRVEEKHYRSLLDRISGDLEIKTEQIVDFELNICDQQPV
jgi:aspartyl aminopeptidase